MVDSIEQLGDVLQVASTMEASAARVAGAAEADKGSLPLEQLPGPLYATSSTKNGHAFYDLAFEVVTTTAGETKSRYTDVRSLTVSNGKVWMARATFPQYKYPDWTEEVKTVLVDSLTV